ncbi:MAG: hypothetical protein IT538_10430 [Variibacter sp.]|nr:hypothetical protein [Variibacter sp.]
MPLRPLRKSGSAERAASKDEPWYRSEQRRALVAGAIQAVLFAAALVPFFAKGEWEQLGFALLIAGILVYMIMDRYETFTKTVAAMEQVSNLTRQADLFQETLLDNRRILLEMQHKGALLSRDEAVERCIANMAIASQMRNLEYYVSDDPSSIEHMDRWRHELTKAIVRPGSRLGVYEIHTSAKRIGDLVASLEDALRQQARPEGGLRTDAGERQHGSYCGLYATRTPDSLPVVEVTIFEFPDSARRDAEMIWAWALPTNAVNGPEQKGPIILTKDARLIEYFSLYFDQMFQTLRSRCTSGLPASESAQFYELQNGEITCRPQPPGVAPTPPSTHSPAPPPARSC